MNIKTSTANDLSNLLRTYHVSHALFISADETLGSFLQDQAELSELQFRRTNQETIEDLLKGENAVLPQADLTIIQATSALSEEETKLLLGVVRNTARNPVCFLNVDSKLLFNDLIGLGFIRKFAEIYTYEIDKYNRTRDWNNSRFWANPEMFGKSWW